MNKLIETIRNSVIGKDTAVKTPFGVRRVTYADYTASGRSLSFIEDFLRAHVLPLYANTHTETSGTGLQTTRFREDARNIIRECVGGLEGEHAVIFAGSGATSAIDRLIGILGIRIPAQLNDRYGLKEKIPPDERPVVFVGPFEHHSTALPWRESIATVVEIAEDCDGHIDLADLKNKLEQYQNRPLKIGSFSAASNVTGILSNTSAISAMLHEHGALSFWDFAAAAPYVDIEMRSPRTHGLDYKDAIFISPHKFIGGPGTPGLLVARIDLLHNRVPAVPGGGTVAYVNPTEHRYLEAHEHREEGGTPAIIESIRAGLVFKLKKDVGEARIRSIEESFIHQAITDWAQNQNIQILGNLAAERLSIVSFLVRAPAFLGSRRYLHHNFVVALLNDLFGIQSRGGCSCAGPYGHRLLGIDLATSHRFEHEIAKGCEVIKPGWVRVNFNYFIDRPEFDFIVKCIHFVANHGWRFLPCYDFYPDTALWRHRQGTAAPPMSLRTVHFHETGVAFEDRRQQADSSMLDSYLAEAESLLASPVLASGCKAAPLPQSAEMLRWFPLPQEAEAQNALASRQAV